MITTSTYTTGGEIVDGKRDAKIESIINDLGVMPPWQACYIDPDNGLLIHIVTLKRRNTGVTTRAANNYYFAISSEGATVKQLWSQLSAELHGLLESTSTQWHQVEDVGDIKSPLSNPDHIHQTATLEETPQTIPERAIEWHLKTSASPLRFGFDSADSLRSAVRTYDATGVKIVYGTELKSSVSDSGGLLCQLQSPTPYEPLDTETATHLETAVESVAKTRRETHVSVIDESLEEIKDAVSIGTLPVDEVIAFLLANQHPADTEPNPMEHTAIKNCSKVLAKRRKQVATESECKEFAHLEPICSITQEYSDAFEAAVTEEISTAIRSIRSDHIETTADEFSRQAESQIAAVTVSSNVSASTVEQALNKELFNRTTSSGVGNKIRSWFGSSEPDKIPTTLSKSIRKIAEEAENNVIPELTNTTGLSEPTVRDRFFEAVNIDVSSIVIRDE